MGEMEVELVDNETGRRFEAWVDGEMVGRAHYRRQDRRVVFTHTKVYDAYEGAGVGSRLARFALDTVRSSGEQVVPLCPFIDAYIRRHPEYADLVDEEMTESLRQ